MAENDKQPLGELMVRTMAMPADTNPDGDIFGGWVLSQMDIAGGIFATKLARGRTVTVSLESMSFHRPVLVGDVVCCYCHMIKKGNTSVTINVDVWISRRNQDDRIKVTEGVFKYVAIDADRRPRPIK
jgi:acyl-CoA thioesterase YciA